VTLFHFLSEKREKLFFSGKNKLGLETLSTFFKKTQQNVSFSFFSELKQLTPLT